MEKGGDIGLSAFYGILRALKHPSSLKDEELLAFSRRLFDAFELDYQRRMEEKRHSNDTNDT